MKVGALRTVHKHLQDDERARGRNSGFVQFMERKSAERAKNALDGTTHQEYKMVVSRTAPSPHSRTTTRRETLCGGA